MTTSLHGRQTASLIKLLGVANHCTAKLEPVGDGWSVCLGNLFKNVVCSFFKKTKLIYMQPGCDYQLTINATSLLCFQTKSGAAKELEQLKKVEEDRNVQRDVISPPPTSPLAFVPPPPPAFSPPPPPPSAPAKPPLVLPAGGNPEAAREALLDAIRSGSGAQRLRKVRGSLLLSLMRFELNLLHLVFYYSSIKLQTVTQQASSYKSYYNYNKQKDIFGNYLKTIWMHKMSLLCVC